MARRSASKRNVTKVHWIWIVLAVIAIAIPLTLFLSNRNTDNRQHAAGNENKVLDVKLSGACKDNKKNPKNSYRRGEYLCENGATGEIPNNNNSCDKRSELMERAQKICNRILPGITIIPTDVIPPTLTPTPPLKAAEPRLVCTTNNRRFLPPGGSIMATLYGINNQPVPNATITWKSEYPLIKPVTSTTNGKGNAYTNVSIPYDMGIKGSFKVTAYFETQLPQLISSKSANINPPATQLSCTTTVYFSSPESSSPTGVIDINPCPQGNTTCIKQ